MLALQSLSALLLHLNKIFVFRKKSIGWIFGMIGAVVITIYLYLQMKYAHAPDFWITIVYDCALFVLMTYGYLVFPSANKGKLRAVLQRWNLPFKIIVSVFTSAICVYILITGVRSSLQNTQFLSTIFGLIGTLLLAFNTKRSNIAGWICYLLAHSLVMYFTFPLGFYAIAVSQIAS